MFPPFSLDTFMRNNAGNSQVFRILDGVIYYFCNTYVQLGANYSVGELTNPQRVAGGPNLRPLLFNAASVAEVGFGPSSAMISQVVNAIIITEPHSFFKLLAHWNP